MLPEEPPRIWISLISLDYLLAQRFSRDKISLSVMDRTPADCLLFPFSFFCINLEGPEDCRLKLIFWWVLKIRWLTVLGKLLILSNGLE